MDTPLFSTDLIPGNITSTLPPGYTLRPLQSGDYNRGVLEVLTVLTTVGSISESQYLGTSFQPTNQTVSNGFVVETIHISPSLLKTTQIGL
jgi:hypothetical protein